MKRLWVEYYRPTDIDSYVFTDENQRITVESWIKDKTIPHLLFSGAAGIGKTTLAKILIKALGVDDYDVLEINASRQTGVSDFRDKVIGFISTMPFGDFKIVLLDEIDYISGHSQAALRGVMETYYDTARFILTCNYPNRVIPALHSRCQGFHFAKIDATEFIARVAHILIEEKVEFELDVLDTYVKATYPDLRKCINLVQLNSVSGILLSSTNNDSSTSDYKIDMVELIKKGQYRQARELLCKQIRQDEIDDMWRWMYDNLELWSDNPDGMDKAILIIRKGLVNHTLVADPEINLSATLIELSQINS